MKVMKTQSGFIITLKFCVTTLFLELTSGTPGFNKAPRGFIQQYVRILKQISGNSSLEHFLVFTV